MITRILKPDPNKMPTVNALILSSVYTAIFVAFSGVAIIALNFEDANLVIVGFLLFIGTPILVLAIRMLANIGQMFFDMNNFLVNDIAGLMRESNSSSSDIKNLNRELNLRSKDLINYLLNFNKELGTKYEHLIRNIRNLDQDVITCIECLSQHLNAQLQQINCDSKDVNKNTHQIKSFFEEISRHIDIKA